MTDTAALTQALVDAYDTDSPALSLGAGVFDETALKAPVKIPLRVLNRHGLIAGATGTGKTKTLQLMAEQLSAQGVPVFVADMKGDLSGLAAAGETNDRISERAADVGQDWQPTTYPVEFFSLGGHGTGIPIRSTVTSFGPTMLSKVLQLSEVQTSSLNLIFHYADKAGLSLLDIKDLRAVVQYLNSPEGKEDLTDLGGLSKATAGVLLRELVGFADAGAEDFFGEPQFDAEDFIRLTDDGKGIISSLQLANVASQPALFSTFLMWLLADLFEVLPEVGDLDKPKLVFFFDEAHLLFKDASKDFIEHISNTVRLIRSKGVGIFFVTQHPTDIPPEVLGQLGSRVQHALRAFTPDDAKALKATVSTYPTSEYYDVKELLTSVGIGEAVVTVLNEKGAPTPVVWSRLPAPQSLMAPAPAETVEKIVNESALLAEYGTAVDRESAYELLNKRQEEAPSEAEATTPAQQAPAAAEADTKQAEPKKAADGGDDGGVAGMVGNVVKSRAFKSFMSSAGRTLGREITRSLFGTSRRRSRKR